MAGVVACCVLRVAADRGRDGRVPRRRRAERVAPAPRWLAARHTVAIRRLARGPLSVACCMLSVACCRLHVVGCMLHVVGCRLVLFAERCVFSLPWPCPKLACASQVLAACEQAVTCCMLHGALYVAPSTLRCCTRYSVGLTSDQAVGRAPRGITIGSASALMRLCLVGHCEASSHSSG